MEAAVSEIMEGCETSGGIHWGRGENSTREEAVVKKTNNDETVHEDMGESA